MHKTNVIYGYISCENNMRHANEGKFVDEIHKRKEEYDIIFVYKTNSMYFRRK